MDIKQEIVKTALKKMFSQSYFDICTIDKCLKLTNTIPDQNIYQGLSALHCINYNMMSEDLRKWVYESTITMFLYNGFDLTFLDVLEVKAPDPEPKQEVKKRRFLGF